LQERLTRRGITLSAVLAALALGQQASAAVPVMLTKGMVQAAVAYAAGESVAGLVPATAAALADGVVKAMVATKVKVATALLLTAGVIAGAAGVAGYQAVGAKPGGRPSPAGETPPPVAHFIAAEEQPEPPPQPAAGEKTNAVVFSGRVLDPDGKPFAGAKLYAPYPVSRSRPPAVRATSDADGQFRFTVARPELEASMSYPSYSPGLLAMADGFGPAFVVPPEGKKIRTEGAVLQLARDDFPLVGRVHDLEGRPIAGVTVTVQDIYAPMKGDLTPFIEAIETRKMGPLAFYEHLTGFRRGMGWSDDMVNLFPPAMTGVDGQFRVPNIGRERVVLLRFDGPAIESRAAFVMTRPASAMRVPRYLTDGGTLSFQGVPCAHAGAPSRPIVGVVRDRDTSKPIAGAIIESDKRVGDHYFTWIELRTVADGEGRYRLTGMPRGQGNELRFSPPDEQPYLPSRSAVVEGPGMEPHTINMSLRRGIWVNGRVTDQATGKPVRARIFYHTSSANSNRAPDTESRADDGSFRLAVPPGPGLITVRAWDDRYAAGVGAERIKGSNERAASYVADYHTLVEIDPPRGAESIDCQVILDPGQTLTGTILGPSGQPLAGAKVSGRTALFFWHWPDEPLPTASFTVYGVRPGRPRVLRFLHDGERLAGTLRINGDEKEPLTIKLEPWGIITGRVVDPDGLPVIGLYEAMSITRGIPVDPAIGTLPNRIGQTDKDGRFRVEGLAPGLEYDLFIGLPTPGGNWQGDIGRGLTLKSGETRDVGDIRLQRSKE
jgi:protocatechuate 3,4-dioxygenase beta subunit